MSLRHSPCNCDERDGQQIAALTQVIDYVIDDCIDPKMMSMLKRS